MEKDTDKLKAELELCKKENDAKSEFMSIVAHQLRTPLAGIKWTFKMLLDGDLVGLTDEQKKVIEKGYESNEQMLHLLNELIIANQNDRWDFQYNLSKLDMEQFLESLITEFLEEARSKDISIVYKRPNNPISLIDADPDKLKIVFQNLIENAIKYTEEGEKITITLGESDGGILAEVKDTGIGICEDQHDKIFQKFFRADNAKAIKKHGTGLGLFTAKRIVERHNGKIWFESVENKGTTFFVELPLKKS